MGKNKRNTPCLCGSGKKNKHCCKEEYSIQDVFMELSPEKILDMPGPCECCDDCDDDIFEEVMVMNICFSCQKDTPVSNVDMFTCSSEARCQHCGEKIFPEEYED